MKGVSESDRFVVGWGRNGKRIAFFIHHAEIKDGKSFVCSPKDLAKKMVELADQIDRQRGEL